eukprot:751982-Hanusia_phi.AAC.1
MSKLLEQDKEIIAKLKARTESLTSQVETLQKSREAAEASQSRPSRGSDVTSSLFSGSSHTAEEYQQHILLLEKRLSEMVQQLSRQQQALEVRRREGGGRKGGGERDLRCMANQNMRWKEGRGGERRSDLGEWKECKRETAEAREENERLQDEQESFKLLPALLREAERVRDEALAKLADAQHEGKRARREERKPAGKREENAVRRRRRSFIN